MAQPAIVDLWFRDRLLTDQGLLSRMLTTAPDSRMGGPLAREEAPETAPAMARYSARLHTILETPPPLASNRSNEPAPRPLSPAARRLWRKFGDSVEVVA
jgi:hypothetical protein